MSQANGRLVILAGPSCAGKSPLAAALARLHPELAAGLRPLVLYNDREARPGERDGVDYHFRSRAEIAALDGEEGFVVMEVRGDLQALDLNQLREDLDCADVLYEGNPFVARVLLTHPDLRSVPRLSVFVSPLGREEIESLRESGVDVPALLTDVMRRKLLRRTRRQKGELSLPDLENIERRAASAWGELRFAHEFDHVIANHDGEDSEHWDAFYHPLGDARRAMEAFRALLEGRAADTERWSEALLGQAPEPRSRHT
jgi:guanylate kinase